MITFTYNEDAEVSTRDLIVIEQPGNREGGPRHAPDLSSAVAPNSAGACLAALPGNSCPAAFVCNAVHLAPDVFLAFGCASRDGRREASKSITSSGQIGHLGAGSDEAPPP